MQEGVEGDIFVIIISQNIVMHSKIYKAKLIAVHSAQIQQKPPEKLEHSKSIHAYFGMLQHIFQRNKHIIRELKLSGTKIQNKNGQEIRTSCRRKKASQLVRSTTKQEKQIAMEIEELSRQKSLPNQGFMLTTLRNRSVQPRQAKHVSPMKESSYDEQQTIEFEPIGQASQRKIDKMNLSLEQKNIKIQKNNSRGVITLNFSHDSYAKPIYSQRQQVQPARKHSLKMNRRSLKAKTQSNEATTNYSSIRTTQNENKQENSIKKQGISGQWVAPW